MIVFTSGHFIVGHWFFNKDKGEILSYNWMQHNIIFDDPPPSRSQQIAYKNIGCYRELPTSTVQSITNEYDHTNSEPITVA